jgi:hypothetical protein
MSLASLRDKIEGMSDSHQEELMKIFKDNNIQMSTNSNGSFINLSSLPKSIIEKLEKYSEYIDDQEKELHIIEDEKAHLKTTFFSNT